MGTGYSMFVRRKNGTYYFRQEVPRDLRPLLNKTQVWVTLKTNDKEQAKRRAKLAAVRVDRMFSEAQQKRRRYVEQPQTLAQDWKREALQADEAHSKVCLVAHVPTPTGGIVWRYMVGYPLTDFCQR